MTTSTEAHGFELKNRRKAPWIVGAVVLLIALAVIVRVAFFGDTASANETQGATLVVATAEGNASEQAWSNSLQSRSLPSTASRSHSADSQTATPSTAPSAKGK